MVTDMSIFSFNIQNFLKKQAIFTFAFFSMVEI